MEPAALAEVCGALLEGGALALGGGEARRRRLDREDAGHRACLLERVEHRGERGADPVGPALAVPAGGDRLGAQALEEDLLGGQERTLDAVELGLEVGEGEARVAGDGGEVEMGVALLGGGFGEGGDQPPTPPGERELGGRAHAERSALDPPNPCPDAEEPRRAPTGLRSLPTDPTPPPGQAARPRSPLSRRRGGRPTGVRSHREVRPVCASLSTRRFGYGDCRIFRTGGLAAMGA